MAAADQPRRHDPVRRIHAKLREHFRRAGPGSIQRTANALGMHRDSLRKKRQRGRLDVGLLYRILEELGVEAPDFWIEVHGAGLDPVAVAKRPTGPPKDRVVQRAKARFEDVEADAAITLSADELRRLDRLRDSDPQQGVRRAKSALRRAERRQIPKLLAIYGSARRVEARLERALEALRWALLLAECGGAGRSERADILQRLGVAFAFKGDHALGLRFAREAAQEHRLAGGVAGEGRSLVDQGSRYFHLQRHDDAVGAYEAALRLLPETEHRNCFSACHSLALIYQRRGAFAEALACLQRAEDLAPKVGPRLSALLLVTKAEIVTGLGDLGEAERCYSAALETYGPLSPIDAALAGVRLARTQLQGGRVAAARETVKGMFDYLEPLMDNKIAGEAVMNLARLALSGKELTLRFVDRVSQAIEQARAQRGRRARRRA